MKNIQLVRIEHFDGFGMFSNYILLPNGDYKFKDEDDEFEIRDRADYVVRNIIPALCDRHDEFNAPWEEQFSLEFKQGQHLCGYKSIEQLQQWVYADEFPILFQNNYNVFLIEVGEALIGEHQICYLLEDVISKTNISSLFK